MRLPLKTTALLASLAGVSMLLVRDVRASAPQDQYETFGAGDSIVRDKYTQLHWQRFVDPALKLDQDKAIEHCANITDAAARWRLPTYKELLTLVDDVPHGEYEGNTIVQKAIDREAFPGTPARRFWSSTKSPVKDGYTVDFGTGRGAPEPPDVTNLVRCVKDS